MKTDAKTKVLTMKVIIKHFMNKISWQNNGKYGK